MELESVVASKTFCPIAGLSGGVMGSARCEVVVG